METTIELVSQQFDVLNLITHSFNFDDVINAFELVGSYSDNVLKAIIEIN